MSFDLHHIIQQLTDNYGIAQDQYRWRTAFVICGPGGSRVDAVTAWLDNQPTLTQNVYQNWRIEPATGRTALPNYSLWFYDRFNFGKKYDDDLYWLKNNRDDQGSVLVQKHHNPDHLHQMLWPELQPWVQYLYIDPGKIKHNIVNMVWEFAVKTLLLPPWRPHVFGLGHGHPFDPSIILDNARALFRHYSVKENIFETPVNVVDYADIISDQGSYAICKLLDITVSEYQHEIWRRGVAAGHAPTVIESYGITWSKSQFADLYDEVIDEVISE